MSSQGIVLVTPNERDMLRDAGDRMPLGALYLSAALKANGIENRVFDLNHTDTDLLLTDIGFVEPDAVGLSFMSPTASQMQSFADRVKEKSPSTAVIAGGVHVINGGEFRADYLVKGYGEDGIVTLTTGKSLKKFDIDRYPIPNREALDKRKYDFSLEGISATTMITSRGCPHRCVFCSNFDKHQKRRSLDNIAEELDQVKKDYDAVYLLDDTFTLNRDFAMQVTEELNKRDLKYRVETRADCIDDKMAFQLARTGCLVAGMGIESGDESIHERLGKHTNPEKIKQAVRHLAGYGIKTKGFFIIGLPGETNETAQRTIQFADELREDGLAYADFYPLMPYVGSPIAECPESYGVKVLDKDPSHWLNGGKELVVPCRTNHLSQDEIKKYIGVARSKWK